jgi:hypothetical protein
MTTEPIPKEVIAALLEKQSRPKNVRADIVRTCNRCDATLQDGYCPSVDCPNNPYSTATTEECVYCGHCETPGKCAWSVVCPICGAGKSLHCRKDGRLLAMHKERWTIARLG